MVAVYKSILYKIIKNMKKLQSGEESIMSPRVHCHEKLPIRELHTVAGQKIKVLRSTWWQLNSSGGC